MSENEDDFCRGTIAKAPNPGGGDIRDLRYRGGGMKAGIWELKKGTGKNPGILAYLFCK